jgi:drug/metabolite transporter (DMT)-like permease
VVAFRAARQPALRGRRCPGADRHCGHAANGHETIVGVAFLVAAVLLSTVGSLSASRNSSRGMPFWPSLGFAMLYGAATCALIALVQGRSFTLPASLSWWLSLLYLALAGSVLTFACFLTLQDRIGPGPTGSIGVMTPLIALVVSMAFEDFRPDAFTFSGAALAMTGNVLMLWRRPRPA